MSQDEGRNESIALVRRPIGACLPPKIRFFGKRYQYRAAHQVAMVPQLRSSAVGTLVWPLAVDRKMHGRKRYQAILFVMSALAMAGSAVAVTVVLGHGKGVSTVIHTLKLLTLLLVLSLMEVGVDAAMDVAGDPRFIVARRFTGRPAIVVVNGLIAATGSTMHYFATTAARTPLPLQGGITLVSSLGLALAKIKFLKFNRPLPIYSSRVDMTAEEAADVRTFWVNYGGACVCFITAFGLNVADSLISGSKKTGSLTWYALLYFGGTVLIFTAMLQMDAKISKAERHAALSHRRSTLPSKFQLIRQGCSFAAQKTVWRTVFVSLFIPLSALPGVDPSGTLTAETVSDSFSVVLGFENPFVALFFLSTCILLVIEPLLSAEDSNLFAASANVSSALIVAVAWIPSLTLKTAGYSPTWYLAGPALVLVVIGSYFVSNFSSVIQRYHHGEIIFAPNTEAANALAKREMGESLDDVGAHIRPPVRCPSRSVIFGGNDSFFNSPSRTPHNRSFGNMTRRYTEADEGTPMLERASDRYT
jgi:hypothetical protein